ncbi:MAG: DUF3618 domain-containing protein [Candidatus Nanopelagicales bacterium]|nr:DUF3618 domain-containing protein [Candidatus Nanopelagicales bacterium]
MPTRSDKKSGPRSPEEIQAEIEQTRDRLAANLRRLKAEVSPKALAERVKAAAVGCFIDARTGQVRVERVVGVSLTVVGIVVIRHSLRSLARRRELERLREVVWVPVPKFALSPELLAVARDAAELAPGPSVLVAELGPPALPPALPPAPEVLELAELSE